MKQLLNLHGGIIMSNLNMLFLIINVSDEKKVINIIKRYNIGFNFLTYGEGTASSSLLEYFDLNDEEKTIIMSVLPPNFGKKILQEIKREINVEEHGNGIGFTIPLSSSTKYMLDFYKNHEMEDIEMENSNEHLIVTIVNKGYSEKVMTEAKKAGATGGTTISGRGFGENDVVKFLKISIETEKDIVLILVPTDKKNDVMNKIVENCGLKSPGAGICFSLPVDNVIGLNKEVSE